MFIVELFDKFDGSKADLTGYLSDKEDNTELKLSDLRKTRLTLMQLNRLRIMSDTRRLEHQKDLVKVQKQFSAPPAEDGPAM